MLRKVVIKVAVAAKSDNKVVGIHFIQLIRLPPIDTCLLHLTNLGFSLSTLFFYNIIIIT